MRHREGHRSLWHGIMPQEPAPSRLRTPALVEHHARSHTSYPHHVHTCTHTPRSKAPVNPSATDCTTAGRVSDGGESHGWEFR